MATLIGATLVWFLGNPDLIRLLLTFTLAVSLIHTVFWLWHTVGGRKSY